MQDETIVTRAVLRLSRRELRAYRAHGLLDDEVATAAAERRVRRIRRLRRDLGMSYDTIAVVVRLVERIEQLEGFSADVPGVRVIGP